MKLTSKQINDIVQDLEAGMKIFINRATLEYRTIEAFKIMEDFVDK
ncbi:MAG: hypothetical protein JXB49_02365 [Bacteroidales bacterium]|nr:hypothetical protein [Bacteroidales bacterium]